MGRVRMDDTDAVLLLLDGRTAVRTAVVVEVGHAVASFAEGELVQLPDCREPHGYAEWASEGGGLRFALVPLAEWNLLPLPDRGPRIMRTRPHRFKRLPWAPRAETVGA